MVLVFAVADLAVVWVTFILVFSDSLEQSLRELLGWSERILQGLDMRCQILKKSFSSFNGSKMGLTSSSCVLL